jgi:hypothetical protein
MTETEKSVQKEMKKETRLAMMRSNPILPCLSTFIPPPALFSSSKN